MSKQVAVAIAASLMAAVSAQEAVAQNSGAADKSEESGIDTIVVTGSRGQPRTVVESPTPIDVVSGAELEKTARPDIMSAINELVPSFNAPAKSGNGTSFVVQSGGLRGLNVDHTLILVNGKRRHRSSHINARGFLNSGSVPVDINLIPVSAVARIEILRDGAAAQYGSDAIAGVINIILKGSGEGGRVNTSFSQNFDRSDGELGRVDVHKGFTFGNGATLDLAFDAKDQSEANRSERIADSIQLYHRINGQPDPREATADRLVELNYGTAPQKGGSVSYNLNVPLSDTTNVYSFATYSQRDSTLVWNFRQPNNINSLPQVYPDGFFPEVVLEEEDFDVAAGIKGEVAGWDWDLGTSYGRDRIENEGQHTINASLGPTSPTKFYYGALQSTDWANTLDFTRRFQVGSIPLQFSWGAEHRYEKYQIFAGDPLSYAVGTYVIPAGQPLAGQRPLPGAQGQVTYQASEAGEIDRHSGAAYLDFGFDLNDRWFVGVAGRYEHFDDAAGDTTIGKLTTRYEITPELALRGAVSTGFKAPALAQWQYASTTSTWRTVQGVQYLNLVKYIPVNSPAAIALGAEPLTPEKSTNYSVGFTYNLGNRFSVTVDAYQIQVDDRIALTGQLSGTAVNAILAANGIVGQLDSAQYFTNAIDTKTKGVDVVSTFRQEIGSWGRLDFSLGGNYNKTDVTHIDPNPPELSALGPDYVLFDRTARGYLTRNPRTKLHFTTHWRSDAWGVTAQLSRWGTYTQVGADTLSDVPVKGKVITNLDVSYAFSDLVNLSVGANNLFNVYPDRTGIYNVSRGSGQYPTGTGYGFTGGSYYARLGVNF